ncbi:MAG TPA: hypothetical protein VFX45_02095 [Solirubrobacterales bacterium]|nr:hypothetical protein [Solirubrobacterales bacterium]
MSDPGKRLDPAQLAARVFGPDAPELTCEECFAELDRYVELTLADERPDEQVPGMRAHLQGCPACAEDYRSLRDFLGDGRSAGS